MDEITKQPSKTKGEIPNEEESQRKAEKPEEFITQLINGGRTV